MRYDRHNLIENWDQNKISSARIGIASQGLLGEIFLAGLSAMGFGNIEHYSTGSTEFDGLEISKRVNTDANIINVEIDASRNLKLLGDYDVFIEATNNPFSKDKLIKYCKSKDITLISASSCNNVGGLGVINSSKYCDKLAANLLFKEYFGKQQSIETSGVIAGIGIEETRKKVLQLKESDKNIEDIILYYPWEKPHFKRHGTSLEKVTGLEEMKIGIVGAGALATPCSIALVMNNVGELSIYDFDIIEDTNLSRQILYYGSVGQKKADVLKERLNRINPNVNINAYDLKVKLEHCDLFREYDVIIDCLDDHKVRALLNYFSRKHNVPLISGSTSHNGGQAITCATACLDCQYDINNKAAASIQRDSCIYAQSPSVITSNFIIGFIQAAQCKNISSQVNEKLKYNSDEEFRLGEIPTHLKCDCSAETLLKKIRGWYNG